MGNRLSSRMRVVGSGTNACIRAKAFRKAPFSARSIRRFARWTCTVVVAFVTMVPLQAGPLSLPNRDRAQAIKRIPLDKLTPEAQQKIRSVVSKPTLFRKMPSNRIACDAQLYRFMVRYPEVVVNIWQLMGITKVSAERASPFMLKASDGVGTVTNVELIYGDQNLHLMYCEGYYDGPLFRRPIKGRCVLLLRSDFTTTPAGTTDVSNTMDVYLQIDNLALDVVTRTLHPIVGKSADMNFVQSTQFLERVWRTSEENGAGMSRLAERLDQVQPDVRQQFAKLTESVFELAQQRQGLSTKNY